MRNRCAFAGRPWGDAPQRAKAIKWKPITDLPVRAHQSYRVGCKAENSKLRTAERLANLMTVF